MAQPEYRPIRTTCDECRRPIVLDVQDGDGLMGAECPCGEYVTRYPAGFWL